jgi:NitT/TauT family transport system substrate-binding protein
MRTALVAGGGALMRRLGLSLVAVVLSTLVAACGGAASQSPASQQVTLRLGHFANLTHATALVGIEQGLFAQSLGSNVTLKTSVFNAGPEAVTALLSGSIDASYLGPNPAVNAYVQSHGQAVRVISGATSGGASLVVKPSITTSEDLRGKKLSTPQLGNTQDVALRWWLGQKGLKTNVQGGGDVSIIPQDNAQTLQSFRSGQIDGAWLPEPWATRLIVEGGARQLVDERDLWPGGLFATTVLAVRTDFLRAHGDVVKRLLQGQVKADLAVNRQPNESQRAANDEIGNITGKKLPDAEVSEAWSHMRFTNDPIAASVRTSADHAQKVGLLSKVDLKGITDLTLLNQVLADQGLPRVSG